MDRGIKHPGKMLKPVQSDGGEIRSSLPRDIECLRCGEVGNPNLQLLLARGSQPRSFSTRIRRVGC